ncbi:MAG: 6,7-dimethyl-8-ribityllumazine synthase [Candidatus Rokubacteria bacterium]|nr:6,7-dimethyl-8-ribityllumazine synthase [Candidatus Rokubacteria bacterium]
MAGRAPARSLRPRRGRGRFAIVAARFNEPIVKKLVDGALEAFAAAGVGQGSVDLQWVPGSFELPLAAQTLVRSRRYAGIACVGCVIKGETPHFDFVAGQAAAGIREVGMSTGVPVTFGVITALTEDQAWARAGGPVGNRGAEAAEAAIEMADVLRQPSGRRRRRRAPASPK